VEEITTIKNNPKC